MSLVAPVSGFQNTLFMMSGDSDIDNFLITVDEMNRVEYAFENLRSQLNSMFIRYPEHSVFPQVLSMVETMIAPVVEENRVLEQVFVESVKATVESFMPWDRFLDISSTISSE